MLYRIYTAWMGGRELINKMLPVQDNELAR